MIIRPKVRIDELVLRVLDRMLEKEQTDFIRFRDVCEELRKEPGVPSDLKERTFQRWLSLFGTSMRTLRHDAMYRAANRRKEGGQSPDEVALALGFSDTSSFRRWMRVYQRARARAIKALGPRGVTSYTGVRIEKSKSKLRREAVEDSA